MLLPRPFFFNFEFKEKKKSFGGSQIPEACHGAGASAVSLTTKTAVPAVVVFGLGCRWGLSCPEPVDTSKLLSSSTEVWELLGFSWVSIGGDAAGGHRGGEIGTRSGYTNNGRGKAVRKCGFEL